MSGDWSSDVCSSDLWFDHARAITVRGEPLEIIPMEEFLWCKLYILQRDHSEAGECELNHRWRHGSHRSTGDEAHNSSSTDKRQGITSAARSTFRRLPICRQAILVTARPETKPAKSETLLILTLLKIPDSNLLWHMRCSDSQAQLVSRRITNESH